MSVFASPVLPVRSPIIVDRGNGLSEESFAYVDTKNPLAVNTLWLVIHGINERSEVSHYCVMN